MYGYQKSIPRYRFFHYWGMKYVATSNWMSDSLILPMLWIFKGCNCPDFNSDSQLKLYEVTIGLLSIWGIVECAGIANFVLCVATLQTLFVTGVFQPQRKALNFIEPLTQCYMVVLLHPYHDFNFGKFDISRGTQMFIDIYSIVWGKTWSLNIVIYK